MKIKTKKIALLTMLFASSAFILGGSLGYKVVAEEAPSPTEVRMENLWKSDGSSVITPGENLPDYVYVEDETKTQVTTAMKVECKLGGSQITYKNPVNISELTRESTFIEMAITTSIRGEYDYGGLVVRMTDTEDENNYVEWEIYDGMGGYAQTYVKISTPLLAPAGFFNGGMNSNGSRLFTSPFCGYAHLNGWNAPNPIANGAHDDYTYPVTFAFDGERYVCYAGNYNEQFGEGRLMGYEYVRNLKEPSEDVNGNVFEGFSADTVYISVGAKNIVGGSAVYYITKFMGLDMTGAVVNDDVAPILQTEVSEENLTAVVNRPYPLAKAKAIDVVDGEIENVKVEIVDGSGKATEVKGDFVTLTEAGKYTLRYSVKDAANNEKKLEYPLSCVMSASPIAIDLEEAFSEKYFVGQTITTPTPVLSGGDGALSYAVTARKISSNDVIAVKDNQFVPMTAGEYCVSYTVTDYIGTTKVLDKFITVETSVKPIYDSFPILPDTLIAGREVQFPEMKAYDYTGTDKVYGKKAIVEIYVSEIKDEKGELIKNSLYTPKLSGNQTKKTIYVTYKTYCEGSAEYDEKTYEVNVVKLNQLTDAFKKSESITTELKDSYIEFASQEEGATFEYVTAVSSRSSTIQLTIPQDKSNFKQLQIVLTDSASPTKTLTLELARAKVDGKTSVTLNGEEGVMDGPFVKADGKDELCLRFSKGGDIIYDFNDNRILTIKKFDDGSTFNGFPSTRMYVKFVFKGVSGDSAVELSRLGMQMIAAQFDGAGKPIPYKDSTSPEIILNGEVPQTAERYQKITIPTAQAYDGIDPHTKCFVSLEFEGVNGARRSIYSNIACENAELFVFTNDYGEYRLSYTATDGDGNRAATQYFSIRVADANAPTISLVDEIEQPLSVGDKLIIPKAIVLDGETNTSLNVVLIGYDGYMRAVNKIIDLNGKEDFEQITMSGTGVYILRYIAHDESYNYTVLDYVITVE